MGNSCNLSKQQTHQRKRFKKEDKVADYLQTNKISFDKRWLLRKSLEI